MKAEIYTKEDCNYCLRAKALLTERGVEYHEYMISPGFGEQQVDNRSYVTREMLLERAPHAKKVPQIWLDGHYIGGFTELDAFMSAQA